MTATKPRPRSATRRRATMTPSAKRYLEAELRWQAELKRKAKAPAPLAIKRARSNKLLRHRYTTAERDEMARKGVSLLDGSHPIRNAAELRREVRFASPLGASRDAVRWHCIKRATSMGLTNLIPWDRWRGDGKLK